ncbi:hypothetical protein POG20_19495, partial [Blautia wexlerae]|nr:hypothetical protein [Blautia wexlerae]
KQRKAPEAAPCLINNNITRSHSLFSGREFRSLRRTAKGPAFGNRRFSEKRENALDASNPVVALFPEKRYNNNEKKCLTAGK